MSYAAHTSSCTFLLDADGICRRIVVAPKGKRGTSRTAVRCVGAQYVASLDGSAAGGLVEMPRVGAAMLFARVDEGGRVVLVRTGVLTSFESNAAEDPFVESVDLAARRRRAVNVQTSAPDLRPMTRVVDRIDRDDDITDPDYFDSNALTARMRALRPDEIAAARGDSENTDPDITTSEYCAADYDDPETLPQAPPPRSENLGMRSSRRNAGTRGSGGHASAAAALAIEPDRAPPAVSSDVQIMAPRRRRGG